MPRLDLYVNYELQASFKLQGADVVLGRAPGCAVQIPDPTVSRRHAEITRDDQGYGVRDAGSLNGTYVDHERVDVAPLQDLNELQIGRFVLTFVFGSGPEPREGGR